MVNRCRKFLVCDYEINEKAMIRQADPKAKNRKGTIVQRSGMLIAFLVQFQTNGRIGSGAFMHQDDYIKR